jgi:hypothetical protein
MDQFESYINKWKAQKSDVQKVDLQKIKSQAQDRLSKHNRKLIISNLWMSIAFAGVFITIGLIWSYFPDRTIHFYAGMFTMLVLLFVFALTQWASVHYKRINPEAEPVRYIKYSLKKLVLNKWILQYGLPIYMVLLGFAFILYFQDIMIGASLQFMIIGYSVTLGYIFLMAILSLKKTKRKIEKINEMISYLKDWENILNQET